VIGIVLGSGLGAVAEGVENPQVTSYAELEGFPRPTVAGHAGQLTRGQISGRDVVILQGRAHLYEGGPVSELITPIRWLKEQGAHTLILTNAAGSLMPAVGPASLMAITDHINLTGVSILRGPNDDDVGPRFPSMRDAYDPALLEAMRAAATETEVALAEGVYCGWMGPAFETPAEIRALGVLGADAVGMSTVHETVIARHCGLRVAAISVITNLAEGLSNIPLSHAQTLTDAQRASNDLTTLLLAFIARCDPPTQVS
jgi:xanthosine phosphorylase